MKVIIVDGHSEDPEEISTCIKTRWPEAIVTLTTAQEDTVRLIKNSLPDLVIIDHAPNEQNGFYLCKEIRYFSEVPIIMLSNNSDEFDSKEVKVRGKQAKLTYIEYNILYHLIKNLGRPLSSEQLLDKVWGQQYLDTKYLPKIHIQHLRQKIERDPTKPKIIVTERGQGYKLIISR